ncbi:MAG: hypothetical protein INR66_12135 [Gordonia polyisoprenivorans]|nr:hypothetical protein [Gordonia polyisoprenivorans]
MTTDSQPDSSRVTIPVLMPGWILQDGAYPYPEDGSEVRFRLEFAEVIDPTVWQQDCLFTGRMVPRLFTVGGESSQAWDGQHRPPRWPAVVDFGHFEAFTIFDTPRTDAGVITGLLGVDYELGDSTVTRIRGRVRRRQLLTEVREPRTHALIATELAPLTEVKPLFRDGLVQSERVIERNGRRFYATAPPTDRPWRRDTGILLDITLAAGAVQHPHRPR